MKHFAYKAFASLFAAYFVVLSTGSVVLHQVVGVHSDCGCLAHHQSVHQDCACDTHHEMDAISDDVDDSSDSQHCSICEFFNQSFESQADCDLPLVQSLALGPFIFAFDCVSDEFEYVHPVRGPPLSI